MKSLAQSLRNPTKFCLWMAPLLLFAVSGWAATLTVTNTADSGAGSLRATIASANSGDDINFAPALSGQTIHLTSGELIIGQNLTVDASGLGTPVIIDAGRHSRVLEITAGTVVIAGLTLTNGACPAGTAGGGILINYGTALTVNTVTISGCTADNGSGGGGIAVLGVGSLTMLFSTISGCTATNNSSYGGAIYTDGNTALSYCTLTGNTADTAGALYHLYGAVTLNNCTIVGNDATTNANGSGTGGGIFNYSGGTLNNCTISGNAGSVGGGIYSAGPLTLTNTIVAGNSALVTGPDIAGSYSGTNNFIGGDPKLAPLGNYGGPTQTMQPLSGSPVIDAGNDSVTNFLTSDQRVSPRLSGAHVDIGAVEMLFNTQSGPLPSLKNFTYSGNGFQFSFAGTPSADFTALTATNPALPLTNWTALGNITEISSGQYQFTDTTATNPAQFYRVVSP